MIACALALALALALGAVPPALCAADAAAARTWIVGTADWQLTVDAGNGMAGGYNLTRNTAGANGEADNAATTWLSGAMPRVHCDGAWFSSHPAFARDDSTDRLNWLSSNVVNGSDPGPAGLGDFTSLEVVWRTPAPGAREWTTVFKFYAAHEAFVFEQRFGATGCPGANTSTAPAPVALDDATSSAPPRDNPANDTPPDTTSAPQSRRGSIGHELQSMLTPMSEFPAWDASNTSTVGSTLGYVTWTGRFSHDFSSHGVGLNGYAGGSEGGPLALFTPNTPAPDALVMSPANHFMTGILGTRPECVGGRLAPSQCPAAPVVPETDFFGNDLYSVHNVTSPGDCCAHCAAEPMCSAWSWADPATDPSYAYDCWLKTSTAGARSSPHTSGVVCSQSQQTLVAGVQGYVTNVEPGYTQSFIVSPLSGSGGGGINAAMQAWGATLRAMHGTSRMQDDIVVKTLGYWTDNGGYYYGGNKPTTQIFTDVVANLTEQGVSLGYVQIDPYWYADAWWPDQSLFPGGLVPLRKAVGVPLLQYANMWKTDTSALYKGRWRFVPSMKFDVGWLKSPITTVAAADSLDFHDVLFANYSALGTIGAFEIDFLDFLILAFPEQLTSTTATETWASGMASAAGKHGLGVQYCMGLPSIAMQSLLFDSVTNARASEDDFPTNQDRWQIAYTATFLSALDVKPFFDVMWTRGNQPGNPYKTSRINVELDSMVATFSAGPVGIGDGLGLTNASLVSRFADPAGSLVHPSVPMTPIDAMYSPISGGFRPPADAEVWQTHSAVPCTASGDDESQADSDRCLFYTVLAVDLPQGYALSGGLLWPALGADGGTSSAAFVMSTYSGSGACGDGMPASGCVVPFGAATAVNVSTAPASGSVHGFDVLYASPVLGPGFAVLGEFGKHVRVSPSRFTSVNVSDSLLTVTMRGAPHEVTSVTVVVPVGSAPDSSARLDSSAHSSASGHAMTGRIVVKAVAMDASGDATVSVSA